MLVGEGDISLTVSGEGTEEEGERLESGNIREGEGSGADGEGGDDEDGSSWTQTPDPLFGCLNPARHTPHSM